MGEKPIKVGFMKFHSDLFKILIKKASEVQVNETQIKTLIIDLTRYTNKLLSLPASSEEYEINIIEYLEFEELYQSIHQELPADKVPMYLVAGAINLKDPDVPGYVAFSLPKSFVETGNHNFTLKELLVHGAHERFERFLHKETIISQVYEMAREDYHESYTLDKEKNVKAFLLYRLNKDLIPLQETITYAITYLVEEFLNTNYQFVKEIRLPLIDREFFKEEIITTEQFIKLQFSKALIDKVSAELAQKRVVAGLKVLQIVTEKFQTLFEGFLELYPQKKSKYNPKDYDFNLVIRNTIQEVMEKNGLTDLMTLFEQELTRL